ncbi:GNAT family N-acetyltransferase [Muricauda sp. 2012CJ35-5]|uniref:GNAT family N-acetyltransferase n=1 Tax=Flagellimonas spongiicola TaxID=2942208 RepID=A0ABT0PSN0_9FLAO|nr:GNAT family protein [Allomuricauda spongiicola]MCL6274394.1 GNAT family N-acetyltransferase [Allomuricauda spongiicola]
METDITFGNYSISPIQVKDAWRLCDFVVSNESRLKEYFPITLRENSTPTVSELFVHNKSKSFISGEEYIFTIKENTNRTIIGLIFVKELRKSTKKAEVAYCISYRFEGQGIMSQAVKEICNWTFETHDFDILEIIAHESNHASIRVAEKNGFIWKKTLEKEHTTGSGTILDMQLYELENNKSA